MKVVGIAGKKQSGKNTVANILNGIVLKKYEMVNDYKISSDGKLLVTTDEFDDWREFDITRKDLQFVEYAESLLYPYVKLYSFADALKTICIDLFNIPFENVYGTNKDKDQKMKHLLWENMPGVLTYENMGESTSVSELTHTDGHWYDACYPNPIAIHKECGPMTAREFLQYFGTDIMRKMWEPIWCQNTVNRIATEQSQLAIVADVRFPNEVDFIKDNGGIVIKLNRDLFEDEHASETQLDTENYNQKNFSYVVDNQGEGKTIERLQSVIEDLYKDNLC